ncbi:hypothetical protein BJY01DRAFT_229850 [Aspergillus pseudoustus]|uniref:Uncharacterized protein n=1 Tax=Aspergillus pseudoustus TaxID=1810923 RepID=A0ABR4IH40_9EURO
MCHKFNQAAIAQGATLRGLEGLFARSRQCRRHYGMKVRSAFREGIDSQYHASIERFTGQKRCRGRMDWLVEKLFHILIME